MFTLKEIKKTVLISLWFVFLTFPLMVIKVDPIEKTVLWRWHNALYVAIGIFCIRCLIEFFRHRKQQKEKKKKNSSDDSQALIHRILVDPRKRNIMLGVLLSLVVIFPFVFDTYQTNIMITALMYVVLGLGLNIVVGMAGLLDLGFVAFYAVGAYSYALLNHHFGLGFWAVLPIGGGLAAFAGILLGFPVLRLRGDYLAIVTLGFGEIIRLILENWNEFSMGPSGISNIDRPYFFGINLSLEHSILYLYYIMILFLIVTIFIVNRLQNSRLGRAWIALREDEIACQAMGIDKRKTKLVAFALGAFWAGVVGVIFAAKTTFINPASFTFLESAIILSIVVLGGMGSIVGVIFGALILILLPEYLRALSEYRMLAFGAILVAMMVFRPQGLISKIRRTYTFKQE
ncbi:high-affinity branched-chain amino acid ABC transporter permease LivM [Desulforhopalus singaporensis]|uniref:Branched-chain amino acid transport system permease protein n=1 Tax=Desulforhopalus singaporensis TaxID=91360 RepID=A0A1H0PIP5_9BACT|nr:high-affinity branched-chain amino acid ABC transporter permease LivM [Desulforhopalus singaporensis]SDP04927.1 branched-chain amino acid transport system permease protein [Desulforhopalus singaporensis]